MLQEFQVYDIVIQHLGSMRSPYNTIIPLSEFPAVSLLFPWRTRSITGGLYLPLPLSIWPIPPPPSPLATISVLFLVYWSPIPFLFFLTDKHISLHHISIKVQLLNCIVEREITLIFLHFSKQGMTSFLFGSVSSSLHSLGARGSFCFILSEFLY